MDKALVLVIANALLYWITFFFYQLKKKQFDLGSILLLIYSITFSSSIFFFIYSTYDFSDYQIFPSLYLYICLLIAIFPILKFKEANRIKYFYNHNQNSIIEIFIFIIAISSIIPCIENLILCLNSSIGTSMTSLGSVYENEINIDDELSWLGRKLNWIINTFQYIIPVLLFYEFTKIRIRKYLIIGLFLGILSIVFNSYANASRVVIMRMIFYFIVCYFLFRLYIPIKRRIIIKKIGLTVFLGTIFLVFLITVARFDYDTIGKKDQGEKYPILTWISLYTGEGSLRFNTQMWSITSSSNGDNCFSLPKEIIGLSTFKSNDERRSFYATQLNIQTDVFYTFIGDFYSDLGASGTIIFLFVLCFLLSKILKHLQNGNIETLIIAALLLNIYMFGFTYFPYKTYYSQSVLTINLVFCLLLYVNRIYSK